MTRLPYLFAALGLAACTPPENAPLYFGQVNTLGVSVGAGPTGASPDFTVGFKNANIAVVPTLDNQGGPIQASVQGGSTRDALSTFGSFDSKSETNSVAIGTFFSTGLPGQRLAGGLGCAAALKAANGTGVTCSMKN